METKPEWRPKLFVTYEAAGSLKKSQVGSEESFPECDNKAKLRRSMQNQATYGKSSRNAVLGELAAKQSSRNLPTEDHGTRQEPVQV
jgi:hypothetical protein